MDKISRFIISLSLLATTNAFAGCGKIDIDRLLDAKATPDQIIKILQLCKSAGTNQEISGSSSANVLDKIELDSSLPERPKSTTLPTATPNNQRRSSQAESGQASISASVGTAPVTSVQVSTPTQNTAQDSSPQEKSGSSLKVCVTHKTEDSLGTHGCLDIGATGAFSLLKATSGTYNYFSASPEVRYRFADNFLFRGAFIALGSPLLSSLDKNVGSAQTSSPSSIFRSNLYVAFGKAGEPSPLFNDNSTLYFSPVIGLGWASQEIDKTRGIYDKGLFVYLGLSTYLASFTFQ